MTTHTKEQGPKFPKEMIDALIELVVAKSHSSNDWSEAARRFRELWQEKEQPKSDFSNIVPPTTPSPTDASEANKEYFQRKHAEQFYPTRSPQPLTKELLATYSPCCGIIRIGVKDPSTVHSANCRSNHGGSLGPTIYLVDGNCGGEIRR